MKVASIPSWRAISCTADELGVVEVDLELAGAELVVGGRHLEVGVAHVPQHRQRDALRVALAADDVDVAGLVGVALPAAVAGGVGLQDVELELGADHRGEADLGELRGHRAGQLAGRLGRGVPALREGLAQAPGGPGLPGQVRERREVGDDLDVGQTVLETTLDGHHVAAGAGVEHGAAERDPVPHGGRQLVDEDVAPAVGPDQVRVRDPDDVDAPRPQVLDDLGDPLHVHRLAHARASSRWSFGTER